MKTFAWILVAGAVVAGVWLVIDRRNSSPWVPDEFVIEGDEGAPIRPQDAPTARDRVSPAAGSPPRVSGDELEPQPTPSLLPGPTPSGPPGGTPVGQADRASSSSPLSPTPRSTESTGGFYVQVGAYGETANAKRRAAELEELGFEVFSRAVDTADGRPATAVRLGPFASRAAAVEAAARFVETNPGASTLIGEGEN